LSIHTELGGILARRREAAGDAAFQAGGLFVCTGLISVVYDLLDGSSDVAVVVDSSTAVAGVVFAVLPWRRWRPSATLVLAIAALALASGSQLAGLVPLSTYGIWFVLIFVWIGMWHPPGTSYLMAPFAAVAYVMPFALGAHSEDMAVTGSISIPTAVLIGETISRRSRVARRAEAAKDEALAALTRANVTDDLTGLGNRRRANSLLDSLEDGDALVILDLDHFKRVNDTLGHHRGDQVLQELGDYLRRVVRDHDLVARYGGEEFIVVIRSTGQDAVGVVQRMLDGWRALGPPSTLSAGLAVKRTGDTWSDTFRAADASLYQAKELGRDRLVAQLVS
jgi:diguanylate cyclase (GGDEF)-like protein